jgi:hypothetical protein|tara:strand:+ start:163 stop:402 length:240 start_codon:yes stop_codon:yes gene_type:complete
MSNYTKATDFMAKDNLPTGSAGKIVKGTEINDEFNSIATAIATKADLSGPTFTGVVTVSTLSASSLTGTLSGTISGGSY